MRLKTTQNTAESYQRHANADPDFPYLIYNEELSGFFKNQNRYNRGSDKEEILQFYDGGSYTVDRKSGISADVPEFYLSILGSTQPKTLQNLVKQRGSESGEFARFLFTHMEQRKHNIPFPQRNGNTRVRRDFSPMLASLYERLMSLDATTYELDYDAQVAFWKAYDHLDSLSIKETHDKYKAALNKAAGQVGRLALIIHCVNSILENPNEPPPKRIGVDTMQRAIKLMWFFLSQSRLVYGLQDDNTGGMAQHLFKIISLSQKLQEAGDEGWVKPRDVVRSYSGNKSIKTDIAKDWLNQLMSMGMGEIQTTAKSIKFRYIPNVDNVDSVETRIDIPIDIAKALYNKDFNQTVDNVDKNFNFCGDYPDYPKLEKDEVGNNLKTNNQSTLSTNRHQMSEPLSGKPFNCREFVDTPSTQESTLESTVELTQESTLESTVELTPESTLEPTPESTLEPTPESTKINCSILCSDHLTEGCRVLHVKTNQSGKVVHLKTGDDGLCQSIKVLWADNSFGEPYPIDLEAI